MAGWLTLDKHLHVAAWAYVAFLLLAVGDAGLRGGCRGRICSYVCSALQSSPSRREAPMWCMLRSWNEWCWGGEGLETENRNLWADVFKKSWLCQHNSHTSSKTAEKEQTGDESWQNTSHHSVLGKYGSRCQCRWGTLNHPFGAINAPLLSQPCSHLFKRLLFFIVSHLQHDAGRIY